MELENIVKLIETVSASELDSFFYEENGIKIKCGKKTEKVTICSENTENGQDNAGNGQITSKKQAINNNIQTGKEMYAEVVSPLVGVFYEAPAEGAAPFVKIGDHVEKGQVLGIIEAMKLMNEIESDTDGIIRDIRVHNTDTVEYGQTLFVIENLNEREVAS